MGEAADRLAAAHVQMPQKQRLQTETWVHIGPARLDDDARVARISLPAWRRAVLGSATVCANTVRSHSPVQRANPMYSLALISGANEWIGASLYISPDTSFPLSIFMLAPRPLLVSRNGCQDAAGCSKCILEYGIW